MKFELTDEEMRLFRQVVERCMTERGELKPLLSVLEELALTQRSQETNELLVRDIYGHVYRFCSPEKFGRFLAEQIPEAQTRDRLYADISQGLFQIWFHDDNFDYDLRVQFDGTAADQKPQLEQVLEHFGRLRPLIPVVRKNNTQTGE